VGKLVVSEFVTVDGFTDDPGGSEGLDRGGWAFKYQRGDDGDRFKLDEAMAADALLLGRVTYEGFAASWPERTDEVGFADKMNGMPKYVVSNTLDKAEWNNSTLIRDNVAEEASGLKQRHAGDVLVYGSATLVGTLADNDLVDEYRLMVFPVVLGGGKPLFGNGRKETSLRLVEARPVGPDGVLVVTYQPAR
jgi:dihydrofolate reductase